MYTRIYLFIFFGNIWIKKINERHSVVSITFKTNVILLRISAEHNKIERAGFPTIFVISLTTNTMYNPSVFFYRDLIENENK